MRLSKVPVFFFAQSFVTQPDKERQTKQPVFSLHSCWEESWGRWWEGQTHNNKHIPLIVHWRHFSLSPPFCSPFTFLSPCASPHYLSLVYSITLPPVLMPSCLLVLIFIYRFSSFSLPFLCTDGTSQLASHSASCLTSPKVNALHSLLPLLRYAAINTPGPCETQVAWTWQRVNAAGKEVSNALCHSKAHRGQIPSLRAWVRELLWRQKCSSKIGRQSFRRFMWHCSREKTWGGIVQ